MRALLDIRIVHTRLSMGGVSSPMRRRPIGAGNRAGGAARGQVRALDLVGSADRLLLQAAIARGAPQMEAAE